VAPNGLCDGTTSSSHMMASIRQFPPRAGYLPARCNAVSAPRCVAAADAELQIGISHHMLTTAHNSQQSVEKASSSGMLMAGELPNSGVLVTILQHGGIRCWACM